jgi:hypothetical protein
MATLAGAAQTLTGVDPADMAELRSRTASIEQIL